MEAKYATEHRCGFRVRGPRLSNLITGNDPLKDNLKIVKCEAIDPQNADAVYTAELINVISDEITNVLSKHPINIERKALGLPHTNMVTLRGAGVVCEVPSFIESHGLKPFMIAPTAIIRGVGKTFGFDLIDDVTGMTGFYDSNLEGKCVRAASEFIENKNGYDFGFVHIKAVDDAGHDKDSDMKVTQLEKVDRALAKLVNMMGQHALENEATTDYILCVTGDHTTPVK